MSRKQHTPIERKFFSVFYKKVISIEYKGGGKNIIEEQFNKPDFAFSWGNKRIGVELSSIDDEHLRKSIGSYRVDKPTKAKKKVAESIENNIPHMIINKKIHINNDLFNKVLKKLEKYHKYLEGHDGVLLVLHCEYVFSEDFARVLKYKLNHFLISRNCLYEKVFLICILPKKIYCRKVFDKKRIKIMNLPRHLRDNMEISEDYRVMYVPYSKNNIDISELLK